jgi:hypothetical protein
MLRKEKNMSEEKERPLQTNHLFLVKMPQPSSKEPPLTSNGLSAPFQGNKPSLRNYFTAEVRKRSPYSFAMVAHDSFHYLRCELPLEFEKSEGTLSLVCQFPEICDEELSEFVEEDETLLGMTLVQFQMQILEHLFAFCAVQNVENLIIRTTEEQFAGLGIYEEFIKYVDQIPTKQGMDVEITILVHSNSLTECGEFMDNMIMQFRKTLWKEQRTNPAIRDYLKANMRLSIVTETSGEPS